MTTVRSSTSTAPKWCGRTCRPARSRRTPWLRPTWTARPKRPCFRYTFGPGSLVAGANTIAVEVHQNSRTSSDLSFDLVARRRSEHRRRRHDASRRRPRALTLGTVTPTSVALSWTCSTDNIGVDHYTVLRNGTPVGTTGTTASPTAPSPTATRTRTRSSRSTRRTTRRIRRTQSRPTRRTSPRRRSRVRWSAQTLTDTTAAISWVASTDNVGVNHYDVYRDNVLVGSSPTASYNDSGLTQQTSYTYTVVAVDAANLSSATSAPLTITTPAPSSTATLVAAGSIWRYLDNGTNQGTAWRAAGFNDSTWASGPALLGYGHGDEATTVGFGAERDPEVHHHVLPDARSTWPTRRRCSRS